MLPHKDHDRWQFGNLSGIVILQLVDVSNNLALLGSNSCQKEEVLQVLIVAEG